MSEQAREIIVREGKYPHIKWLNLKNDGTATECAIVKSTMNGIFFIPLRNLDNIDLRRIFRIIMSRNSGNIPLWDLMSQVTLKNGINALEYFHQYVKVITPTGKIMVPRVGVEGIAQAAPPPVIRREAPRGESQEMGSAPQGQAFIAPQAR